jgi:hypothetical protein
LFEHTTAALAVAVETLGNVIVAPRCIEARVGFIGSRVEDLGLFDGFAYVVGQLEL